MKAYLKHREDFFAKWTPESAYVLGFIEADGHLLQKPGGKIWLRITLSSKDQDHIYTLREVLGFDGKVSVHTPTPACPWHNHSFSITSHSWKEQLEGNLRTGHIPVRITDRLLPHYIRGYFDGNGSVYWEGGTSLLRVGFCGPSESFITDIRDQIGKHIGISKGMLVRTKANSDRCWYFRIAKQNIIHSLADWMYEGAGIYLARKHVRFYPEPTSDSRKTG